MIEKPIWTAGYRLSDRHWDYPDYRHKDGLTTEEREELLRLRREMRVLRDERDIRKCDVLGIDAEQLRRAPLGHATSDGRSAILFDAGRLRVARGRKIRV